MIQKLVHIQYRLVASGSLEANYIELISTEISSSHGIVNDGGDISANRLKLDSNGLFRNQERWRY